VKTVSAPLAGLRRSLRLQLGATSVVALGVLVIGLMYSL